MTSMRSAPLINANLLGDPTAPTAAPGDADQSIATTAFVAAAAGKKNAPVFNVQDPAYGAKGDGTTDDSAAFVAAHAAATLVGGGIIYMPAATYRLATSNGANGVIVAAPNLSGKITWRGAGMGLTTLHIVAPCATFQTCNPDNTVPTYQGYAFEDFSVNMNGSSTSNKGQLLHYGFSATGNVANVGRHEVTRISSSNAGHSIGVERDFLNITVNRNVSNAAVNTVSHIYVTDCYAGTSGGGGSYGIALLGFNNNNTPEIDALGHFKFSADGSLSNPASVIFDHIYIRNFHHNTGQTPLSANGGGGSGSSVGIQIGGSGVVKHARIWGGSFNNNNDVGIEIDNAWDVVVDGVTIRNPHNTGILVLPIGTDTTDQRQAHIKVINTKVIWEDTDTSGNPITAWAPTQGFVNNSRYGFTNGRVTFRDCDAVVLGGYTTLFSGGGAFIPGPARQVTLDNCSLVVTGTPLAGSSLHQITGVTVRSLGQRQRLNIRNFYSNIEGTADNTDITFRGLSVADAAHLQLNVDGLTMNSNLTALNGSSLNAILVLLGASDSVMAESFATDQLDSTCSFVASTAADYTYDATNHYYTASANLTTEKRFLYLGSNTTTGATSLIRTVQDGASYAKMTTGASITGYKAGAVGKRIATTTYLEAYIYDDGTHTYLCLDKVVAGTRTSLLPAAGGTATGANFSGGSMTTVAFTGTGTSGLGIQLATRIAASTSYWCRIVVIGDLVIADHFNATPTNINTRPTTTTGANVQVTLTAGGTDSKNFGALSPLGNFGISHIPVDSAAILDDVTHQRAHVMSGTIRGVAPLELHTLASAKGIQYQPGAANSNRISDKLRIRDCDFSTLVGTVTDFDLLTTDTAWMARLLREANNYYTPPAGSAITVGASVFTYQNLDGYRERVGVYGGTVSAVSLLDRSGTSTQIASATGIVVTLDPGDSISVTYSSAPTMTKTPIL